MNKPAPDFSLNDMLDEIIDIAVPPPPPDNSFTAAEYHERLAARGIEIVDSSAQRQLDRLVDRGTLQSAMAWLDGRHQRVYWKPE